jgi:hypothetical protein
MPESESAPESGVSHWVGWHAAYEDPDSPLSRRLWAVQAGVTAALDEQPPGPISLISLCAGQGRDVIDVVAGHQRGPDVRALLVEQDPALVTFARSRAAAAGVGDRVQVVEGDAAVSRLYAEAGAVPAGVVLVCGVFGNISREDIAGTVEAMPSFCAPGGSVIWTRHRRPPDMTPFIREAFARAGFEEQSFVAPEGFVLGVGRHRAGEVGGAGEAGEAGEFRPVHPFDPDLRLFEFIGDGTLPA